MGAFKHVIVQALLLHLTPRHIPGVSRTHMGVPAGCSVTSTSDKAETPGNQVCSENGDTRHLTCDNCTLLCPHPDGLTQMKMFALILTNQKILFQ